MFLFQVEDTIPGPLLDRMDILRLSGYNIMIMSPPVFFLSIISVGHNAKYSVYVFFSCVQNTHLLCAWHQV